MNKNISLYRFDPKLCNSIDELEKRLKELEHAQGMLEEYCEKKVSGGEGECTEKQIQILTLGPSHSISL